MKAKSASKSAPKVLKPKAPLVLPEFRGKSKQDIIAELGKSPHGKLEVYHALQDAVKEDAEFFAHLTTWNAANGQVKDARVALPVVALSVRPQHPELVENALANLAGLDLRLFVRAVKMARTLHVSPNLLRRLVTRRLRELEPTALEDSWKRWDRAAVQHRASVHYLYRFFKVPCTEYVSRHLFGDVKTGTMRAHVDPVPGTIFHAIQQLPKVTAEEAAGLILKFKLPFLIVKGALGKKATDPAVAFALIQAMTPTELIANTKDLEKNYNLRSVPELRAAFEKKIEEAKRSKKGPTLKAQKAAEDLERIDEVLASKMRDLQEQKMEEVTVEGDWLVLGDKSGSMQHAISKATDIAATLARSVKGKVHLIFFDTDPRYMDVSGKTLAQIKQDVRHLSATGGTSIGCGVAYVLARGLNVDGIALVSDGAEHHQPYFLREYERLRTKADREIPIYFYQMTGEHNTLSGQLKAAGIEVHEIDGEATDYYSLPNLLKTMRISKYSLLDEIMNMPLVTLDEILPHTKGMQVISHGHVAATA